MQHLVTSCVRTLWDLMSVDVLTDMNFNKMDKLVKVSKATSIANSVVVSWSQPILYFIKMYYVRISASVQCLDQKRWILKYQYINSKDCQI